MDFGIKTKIADLGRLHEIVSMFVRYGFGDMSVAWAWATRWNEPARS